MSLVDLNTKEKSLKYLSKMEGKNCNTEKLKYAEVFFSFLLDR